MRNGYYLSLAVLMFLFTASVYSCKKKGKDNTIVTIVNRLDQPMTIDLYGNEADYAANSNLLESIVVKANENISLPGSTFKSGGTYYMDWYSDDYYHNNWFNDDYPIDGNRVRITPKPGNNTYYLEPSYKGNGRKAFLKGDGTQTGWIAVGAYLYSNSTGYNDQWDVISVNERYRQITIRKDFTAVYMSKNKSGSIVSQNLEFLVQPSEVPYIEFKTANGDIGGNMTGGRLPVATPPDYKSNSLDTIMALFPDNEYIFMMVRQ